MTAFTFGAGTATGTKVNISGTSATTIIEAKNNNNVHVLGLRIVNASSGALTPVVDVHDGTNTYIWRDNANLADQASENLVQDGDRIFLKSGEALRVTANTGLSVFASYVVVNKNST